jgi:hypothetical protein
VTEIPKDIMAEARRQCDACGITPHSDMRIHAENVAAFAILAERERADRYGKALAALDRAAKSAIRENDMPNRVIFKDGFVVEGRAADEWLKFLRLIIDVCEQAAAIRSQS